MGRYLFDTHAFLWWLESDTPNLRAETTRTIADSNNAVFVSVVNAWEIAIKISSGRLQMNHRVSDLAEHYGFNILPILLPHAAAVERLPQHHRDPFDRMLVAQALVEGLTLITSDRNISRYEIQTLQA